MTVLAVEISMLRVKIFDDLTPYCHFHSFGCEKWRQATNMHFFNLASNYHRLTAFTSKYMFFMLGNLG